MPVTHVGVSALFRSPSHAALAMHALISQVPVPPMRPNVKLSPQPAIIKRIIKLGGAAITHKCVFETPNHDVIGAVAQHVAQAYRALTKDQLPGCQGAGLVIVHGAGSFGHHQACLYGVSNGWASASTAGVGPAGQRQGFTETRASVAKLNCVVVDALIAEGLPAVGLSPFSSGWSTSGRQVLHDGCEAIRACLDAGLLPVLHGDCVLDSELGCTILSGDTIMRRIVEAMDVKDATFLTNVSGVFDRSPDEEGANQIADIFVQTDGSWHVSDIKLASSSLDATGGIAKKVEEASVIAALGTEVAIALAGSESGRLACMHGPSQLRLQAGWGGTCVRLVEVPPA